MIFLQKNKKKGAFAEVHKVQNAVDKEFYAAKIYAKFE